MKEKQLLIQLRDLLAFEVKSADRFDLHQITITKARAKTIIADINAALGATPKLNPKKGYEAKLDKYFNL